MRFLILAMALMVSVHAFGQHQHPADEVKPATLVPGLGEVHHPVATASAEAQRFFNQGLAFIYAFNHEEAIRSFKRAAELDPQMAMAYWGESLALGSNYNLQADAAQQRAAYDALQKALALAPRAPENERAYIEALSKRYSADPQADRQQLGLAYKSAMSELVKRYPDDLDAATLYAESMMNLRPWQLWKADGKPAEGTEEIVAVLEGVLRRNPSHTGANHYYIHAVEASPNPERALPSAARLEKLAPSAGHLVHMPSHIYVRTGDYVAAAESNAEAIVVDRNYIEQRGAGGVYPMMYYNHNIHFLASAHGMNGRYADAIKAARELEANVSRHVKQMPMLEMFMPYPSVTLVRFRRWDEILKQPAPDAALKMTTAFWRFARGMAYAGTGQADKAEAELKAFRDIASAVPSDAPWGNSTARGVLLVAENMLAGKLALARGDKQAAVASFRKSVEAEDALNYNEPADWDIPARESLGGALLSNGDDAEAERVFRAELLKHPRNGRALFGLIESLKRQDKKSSVQMVEREFDRAWEKADTKLTVEDLYETRDKAALSSQHRTQPLRFADVRLKTGVRLHYAEQGDPKAQPVVLLHGYTDSWFSYSRVLPALGASYHAYALDLRGHGDSERPAEGYAVADMARDVVAFMDAKGLKRVTLVGHSMGSLVAQRVAIDAPARIERLVLVASATNVRNANVLDLQQAVNGLRDPVPEKFVREFQMSTIYAPVPDEFLARVVAESRKLPARVWQALMTGMLATDHRAELSRINAPTLILWGDKEAVFPRSELDALASALPNARTKVYPETGHALHWERPERFVEDLKEFIASTRTQSS